MEALQSHDAKSHTALKSKAVVFSSRYTLVKRLAEGGTSVLFLAKDKLSPDSLVVLKCIHSNLLRSESTQAIASNEFAIAKQLSHPNLISVYDFRRDKGLEYLVMEYLSGDSLKDILSRSDFSYERAMQLMDSLVGVLSYLHSQGVIHSDVKPSNIIITKDNRVKLIDLANCRQDRSISHPSVIITSEHFFGYSLDYSSPQVISDRPATASDDVFSLGCVLYEMLEGRSPIPAKKQAVDMSLTSVKKPKAINFFQWRVLGRAMSTSAERRYQSVEEFYCAFRRAKHIPKISFGLFVSLVALMVTALFIWGGWQAHRSDHLRYKSAYEQQQSVQRLVSSIKSYDPMARYEYLNELTALPDVLKQGALVALHDDVVLPVTNNVQESLFASTRQADYSALNERLSTLSTFYPNSKDILLAKRTVAQEQKMLIDGLVFGIQELAEDGNFSVANAEKFNQTIDELFVLDTAGVTNIEKMVDTSFYNTAIRSAIAAKDWVRAGELYQFARQTQFRFSAFFSLWSGIDAKLVANLADMSGYLSGNQYTLQNFPSAAALYFSGADLRRLQDLIKQAFYNKDIKRYADQLLAIQSKYRIPEDFPLYKQTESLLLNKIRDKIRFHNSKRQFKSAKSLSDLALNLTD